MSGLFRFFGLVLVAQTLGSLHAVGSSLPQPVTLAWERNPEPEVAGYKIYWGEVSRQYTQVLDVEDTPSALLTNLEAGKTYHFAVTAYNGALHESPFSQEIVVSIAPTNPVAPDTSGRLVRFEAESGQLGAPMAVFNGPAESWVDTSSYTKSLN